MARVEQPLHTDTSYVFDGAKRRPRTELPMDENKREVRKGEVYPGVFLQGEL